MIEKFFALFSAPPVISAFHILWSTKPIWIPVICISAFYSIWIRYVRAQWIQKEGSFLVELKLPKEVSKSPAAMELILGTLSQPSVGSYIDVYLKGRVRPWFSLELVSLGGQVKFFIWGPKKFKNLIESQIYAQFPTVEVHETPDYALQTSFPQVSLFGMQLKLTKADVYPIKTYIDYGLDKNPDEEFKIDPITPLIEYLGALKPDEQAWVQILVQAHKKENLKDLRIKEKPDWKKSATKEIEEILKSSPKKEIEDKASPYLTDEQKDTINAIQRNISKPAFETMIRGIYMAKPDSFNPINIAGLTGAFKQFGSGNLNGFAPKFTTSVDYPWQDFRGKKVLGMKKSIMDAYKRRSFFHPPYKFFEGKFFILTTEELATLFHFPGGVASTPTFSRIVSKKGEAPANLPL